MEMLDYIKKTPAKMKINLQEIHESVAKLANRFLKGGYESAIIIASGSSYNAARISQTLMSQVMKIPVTLITSEQLLYNRQTFLAHPFYFAISQSGASTNTIAAVKNLQTRKLPYVVLTGNLKGEISNYSQELVDYGVGIETVKFVTLGVATLVEFLTLFAFNYAARKGYLKESTAIDQFEQLIEQYQQVINGTIKFVSHQQLTLAQMRQVFICGNDVNYGAGCEGALKFQEKLHLAAMPIEVAEFLHGPDMQLDATYTVFLIDDFSSNPAIEKIFRALGQVITKRYLISNQNEALPGIIRIPLAAVPDLNGFLVLPIFQVISASMSQLLAIEEPEILTQKFRSEVPIKEYGDEKGK